MATLLTSASPSPPRALASLLCLFTALCLIPIGLTARREIASIDARSPATVRRHRWAALLAFVSIVTAIHCHAASITLRPLVQVAAFGLGAVALAVLLAMVLIRPGPYHGALQKILVTAIVLWIGLVSLIEA